MNQSTSLGEILKETNVFPDLTPSSKKQLLQKLSEFASQENPPEAREIFEELLQRERLGTTAIGDGVAIPHARIPKIEKIYGLFAKLSQPVEFEAPDNAPVDLIFLLIAPDDSGAEHLKALAKISRLLRNEDILGRIRGADDQKAIYAILTENVDTSSES